MERISRVPLSTLGLLEAPLIPYLDPGVGSRWELLWAKGPLWPAVKWQRATWFPPSKLWSGCSLLARDLVML